MVNASLIITVFSLILIRNDRTEVVNVCVSDDEKRLYDIINAYRETKGLRSIPFSQSMTMVAQAHVQDLVENYTFKQNARCNPHSWSENGDWSDCCYTSDHKKAQCMWDKPKEIAGYKGYGYEILFYSSDGASPSEALNGWQNSPGHHSVMINKNTWSRVEWKAMGVGIAGEYAVAWFGEDRDKTELTNLKVCE
jgi:uncharacterized protein YkwD